MQRNLTKTHAQELGLDSQGVTKFYKDAKGKRRCTGGPLLKGTQAYTPAFAKAICDKAPGGGSIPPPFKAFLFYVSHFPLYNPSPCPPSPTIPDVVVRFRFSTQNGA